MSTTDTLATRTTDLPTAVSDLKLEAVVIPVIRQMRFLRYHVGIKSL